MGPAGIHERAVAVDDPVILKLGRADLDDGVVGVIQAGGLQIECDESAGHGVPFLVCHCYGQATFIHFLAGELATGLDVA